MQSKVLLDKDDKTVLEMASRKVGVKMELTEGEASEAGESCED